MKNYFKKTFWFKLLFVCLLVQLQNGQAQIISDHFFGENAWMPDTIGNASACIDPPCILYGKLHNHWNNVKNSGATLIRFGGITPDKNMPTNFQYLRIIDSIRAKGMEPMIQVPFHNYRYTASQAADIVYYLNVTKGKNIKYWVIANEPDLEYSFTSASQISGYFKAFASAMKNIDPSILIIGPECAWFNKTIMDGLTNPGGPDDITGKDPSGRYYLDVISFHTYPFNGSQTRAQVISKLTSSGSLQDNLIYLNSRVSAANNFHNRTGAYILKTAITEANINWQNSTTDNLSGVGASSFIGGQFVAEMLGIGMKNKVDFINIWSVIEGNSTALNIGYLDRSTGNKKPLYYHFKLLADNFNGNYVNATSNQPNLKSFGSQNNSQIVIMIMNQEETTNYNYTVRLNTSAVGGSNPLKINVDAGVSQEYSDYIENQSSVLLIFNTSGSLIKKCEYTLSNHALANIGPTCTEFITAPLPVSLLHFNARLIENGKVELKWATASEINNDYFTIQKTIDGSQFEDVALIKGSGNSSQTINYVAHDKNPSKGLSYYRLKQTDYDGKNTFYGFEEINLNSAEDYFTVYPNPSNGLGFTVNMRTNIKNSKITMTIYDTQGRKLYSENKAFDEPGDKIFELGLNEKLPSGIYFITVQINTRQFKNKLVVN